MAYGRGLCVQFYRFSSCNIIGLHKSSVIGHFGRHDPQILNPLQLDFSRPITGQRSIFADICCACPQLLQNVVATVEKCKNAIASFRDQWSMFGFPLQHLQQLQQRTDLMDTDINHRAGSSNNFLIFTSTGQHINFLPRAILSTNNKTDKISYGLKPRCEIEYPYACRAIWPTFDDDAGVCEGEVNSKFEWFPGRVTSGG